MRCRARGKVPEGNAGYIFSSQAAVRQYPETCLGHENFAYGPPIDTSFSSFMWGCVAATSWPDINGFSRGEVARLPG